MNQTLPIVAIIGRPNVGKSTLFNALIGQRKAIVSDIPNTTRDSVMQKIREENLEYLLLDTAGLTSGENSLEKNIQAQARLAVSQADVLLFLIDGHTELTSDDYEIIELLRKESKPIFFLINKLDDGDSSKIWNFASLGLSDPLLISAKNYIGIKNLSQQINEKLNEIKNSDASANTLQIDAEQEHSSTKINIAIVGRPNVGKSSLLNKLCNDQISVVSDIAGTTRDSIDTEIVDEKGQVFRIIDTAGLRKKGKFHGKPNDDLALLEYWSSVRTRLAIEEADICLLVIDALDGITHQDLVIAGMIVDAGKGVVLCVNKFDIAINLSQKNEEKLKELEDEDKAEFEKDLAEVPMWGENVEKIRENFIQYLSHKIGFLPFAPVLFMSALTGKGVKDIFENITNIDKERKKRVPTAGLNKFLQETYFSAVLPSFGTKKGKFKYATQVEICPPSFIFFVNNIKAFHFSYKRFLENKLRKKYGFFGTSIKIEFRDARSFIEKKEKLNLA